MLQNRGVSFALAEAEMIWMQILKDAVHGELQPVYGADRRWAGELHAPVLIPPSERDLRRYIVPMLGIYPARGCPFTCNFCSVIKIAGRQVRSQPIETTMESLRKAKAAGVRMVMFTSDNGPWLCYGNHAGSAGPLREGKGTMWEGGYREPCVMRWPGKIPAGGRYSKDDSASNAARLAGGAASSANCFWNWKNIASASVSRTVFVVDARRSLKCIIE